MNRDNVIEFKTKTALFNPGLKSSLQSGIAPYLKDGEDHVKAVNTIEQIICTALICAVRSLATKLATKIANKFAGDNVSSYAK